MKNENKLQWEKVYSERSRAGQLDAGLPLSFDGNVNGIQSGQIRSDNRYWQGDRLLVDFLLREGYSDITGVDISARALEKARARLGEPSGKIQWLEADIRDFMPQRSYAHWHDRATLISSFRQRKSPIMQKQQFSLPESTRTWRHFRSPDPEKCNGLPVSRYSEHILWEIVRDGLTEIEFRAQEHITPMQRTQDFFLQL